MQRYMLLMIPAFVLHSARWITEKNTWVQNVGKDRCKIWLVGEYNGSNAKRCWRSQSLPSIELDLRWQRCVLLHAECLWKDAKSCFSLRRKDAMVFYVERPNQVSPQDEIVNLTQTDTIDLTSNVWHVFTKQNTINRNAVSNLLLCSLLLCCSVTSYGGEFFQLL